MTKSEARKMARLEAENSFLRSYLATRNEQALPLIQQASSYMTAIFEIEKVIAEAREFAK